MIKNKFLLNSLNRLILSALLVLVSHSIFPSVGLAADDPVILRSLKQQISETYGSAQVKFARPIEWIRQTSDQIAGPVQILNDNGRGELRFSVTGLKGQYSEGLMAFSAWLPARIAVKRVHPGELLRDEWFTTQKVNVSSGTAREFRGVLLAPDHEVSKLESVQTIMEGQFLTSSAVRNVPDIRRGDSVRIQLVNEGMTLTTSGIAQEPGYLNRQIRVLTTKTKRELLGQLQLDGIVEVKL
jgi:flagella basal body P-ring formation protein FlgA